MKNHLNKHFYNFRNGLKTYKSRVFRVLLDICMPELEILFLNIIIVGFFAASSSSAYYFVLFFMWLD